jgi:hypothetical protein
VENPKFDRDLEKMNIGEEMEEEFSRPAQGACITPSRRSIRFLHVDREGSMDICTSRRKAGRSTVLPFPGKNMHVFGEVTSRDIYQSYIENWLLFQVSVVIVPYSKIICRLPSQLSELREVDFA